MSQAERPVPVYDREGVVLYHGDCMAVLPTLAENSVHAVVTDPPYELTSGNSNSGFMNQKWDGSGVSFRQETWAAVYKVLRPGGHLLAFGGTRRFHRLACAIEDAGFEIRDSIACFGWQWANLCWLFGSGFPKSLDVSKSIDRQRKDQMDVDRVRAWLNERREGAGLTLKQINQHFGFAENGGGLASSWMTNDTNHHLPTWDQWVVLKDLIAFGDDMDDEVRRLNDRKGTPGEAWEQRPKVRHDARPESSGTMCGSTDTRPWIERSRDVGYHETAGSEPVTEAAKQWQGWGSALKPSHEPIILARKPLSEPTICENVLKWGTGALNVGACRVGTTKRVPGSISSVSLNGYGERTGRKGQDGTEDGHDPNLGRFAPNAAFVHHPLCIPCGERRVKNPSGSIRDAGPRGNKVYGQDGRPRGDWDAYGDADGREVVQEWRCHPSCPVAELDRQGGCVPSSFRSSPKRSQSRARFDGKYAGGDRCDNTDDFFGGYDDEGSGASRFFPTFSWDASDFAPLKYQGKATRSERESGLIGHVPCATCGSLDTLEHRDDKGRMVQCVRNMHPTIKPCSLLSWLSKLVCPPGGVILDPFCGTASGGRAAILEGFRYIGIEREPSSPGGPDYVGIARWRLENARLDVERPNRPKPKGSAADKHMPLFDRIEEVSEGDGGGVDAGGSQDVGEVDSEGEEDL